MAENESRTWPQGRFQVPPDATDVLLVRHGESAPLGEFDVPMVDGHADPPLSPLGEAQARRVAERLAVEPIDAVYVTTLRRTAQTAAPLLSRLGVEAVVEPDLREVHLGEWEGGRFRRFVAERHPLALRMLAEERWDVVPGAESGAVFADRVRSSLTRLAAAWPGGRVVVFTHGGVIGTALALAARSRGFAFVGADNASISQLVLTPERWIVRRYNDTAHLGPWFPLASEPLE